MSEHRVCALGNGAYATSPSSLKNLSPVGLQNGIHTLAEAGDVTPTPTRPSSPFRVDADASNTSVDRSEPNLEEHTYPEPERRHLDKPKIYDSLSSTSLNSTIHSRSLTPKHRPLAFPSVDDRDMPNSSSHTGPSSGPARSTPARRQQQSQQHQHHHQQHQRGLQSYGYYVSPSTSESGFPRNSPSISSQGAPPPFAHTQHQTTSHRTASYVGQYTMSPPPASLYPQHHHQPQHPYAYPSQINASSMPSHSTSDFFTLGGPNQPPLYASSFHTSAPPEHAPSPAHAYEYDGGGSSGRSPGTGNSTPYTSQPPFASFNYHPTLTPTPQFAHSHSSFSPPFQAHQAQHAQRPQYPPSFAYMTRASPTTSEDTTQQQQPPTTWWYIPSHSASPSAAPYPSMYYVDAYGNPSNPSLGLGPGFQSLPSSSSPSAAMQPPALSLPDGASGSGSGTGSGIGLGGLSGVTQLSDEGASKSESNASSHAALSLSPPAFGESVSERGQQQQQARQLNRRSFLPNPPAQRSEWVMWVGNVPSDTTHDELWRFFTRPISPNVSSPIDARLRYGPQSLQPPILPAGLLSSSSSSSASDVNTADMSRVASVFLIARSNCAFVNYSSAEHLAAAIRRFNGVPLRPNDPRCQRLVCRVRGKEEDLRAGVGGQRGTGMHTRWVREQREREKAREEEGKVGEWKEGAMTDGEDSGSEAPGTPLSVVQTESGSSAHEDRPIRRPPHHSSSSGSTTSGFLARYFPKRYFILKSLTQYDLDLSVEKGVWATQPHNETVLNQAFRNSSDVYLIFGVNKSGEFFGYARMASLIGKAADDRVSWASRTDSQHSHSPATSFASSVKGSQMKEIIPEEHEGSSPEGNDNDDPKDNMKEEVQGGNSVMLFSPSEHRLAEDSPQPVTPHMQKRLTKAEESDSGKVPLSSQASTAPPSDRHHEKLKGPVPQRGEPRPLPRPTSPPPPTSAPAVMGPPYRRITNPRVDGLSSETMDPRTLRHRLPSVKLDPQAPINAIRNYGSQDVSGEVFEDADRVKRRDTYSKSASASGSSGSKLRGVILPKPLRAPLSPDPELEGDQGAEAQTKGMNETEHGDLPSQWGSPFKVQWIRVGRLPFHRTRHLRNPWNHEREVKVSRDGTELEPGVGQELLDEWDKEEPSSGPPTPGTGGHGIGGPSSSSVGRRGNQFRRMQTQVPNLSTIDSEAGPGPGSPRAQQIKHRPR